MSTISNTVAIPADDPRRNLVVANPDFFSLNGTFARSTSGTLDAYRGGRRLKRDLMIGVAISMMIAGSPIRVSASTSDTAEIKALEQRLIDGVKAKDAKQIMSCYSDDVFAFDVVPPREYVGAAAFQKPWQGFLDTFKGPINAEVNDLVINSDGKIAYSHSVQRASGTTNEGKPFDETFRITDVYRKSQGKWVIVQEHISMPPQAAR